MSKSTQTRASQRLHLESLEKIYNTRGRPTFHAVKGLNLDIEPGEFVALLGPSGCGKTTTLRMIAGLETVTSGKIYIGDNEVQDLKPGARNVGVGFESYALYPPMTIRKNLEYGLRARNDPEAAAKVQALAERLEMTDLLELRPAGLSSGQKQRVALARALMRVPPVLLLDEPLSHLDASARQRVRRELKVIQREGGYTAIVVTHDQQEALSLADRMAVMNGGIIQQFGTPEEIFDDPANVFVADFVGEPKINFMRGTVFTEGSQQGVKIGAEGSLLTATTTARAGTEVIVGVRPHDILTNYNPITEHCVKAKTTSFENLLEFGQAQLHIAGVDDEIVALTEAEANLRIDADQYLTTRSPEQVYLFDPETEVRIR